MRASVSEASPRGGARAAPGAQPLGFRVGVYVENQRFPGENDLLCGFSTLNC